MQPQPKKTRAEYQITLYFPKNFEFHRDGRLRSLFSASHILREKNVDKLRIIGDKQISAILVIGLQLIDCAASYLKPRRSNKSFPIININIDIIEMIYSV